MEVVAGARGIQDDDAALAKLLQEQERALLMFGRPAVEEEEEPEELPDEELARRLQEEEDRAAYEAMAQFEAEALGEQPHDAATGSGEDAGLADDEEEAEEVERAMSYEELLALGELAGKVSTGLAQEALERLPVAAVAELRASPEGAAMALDKCCICQMEFEDEDEATALPCRHCYHPDCARQWLAQKRACALCGKELEQAAAPAAPAR
ncbi:hypothetical protein HYH03_000876 [Edaphochlamys debaryana]|uniref:RING-type domain-containing protein n=1 Tax=Edaphochlamys debaryana TaxID=47281 RepID=A0A836C6T4_9CHLO|nr:hypothetical protein HYH03_000876 [Edaphochlamys debaryana]|eukprot:KAG2501057.1 hypothetical protein HYH03_000876 [Edaphochlamys debaryana]